MRILQIVPVFIFFPTIIIVSGIYLIQTVKAIHDDIKYFNKNEL